MKRLLTVLLLISFAAPIFAGQCKWCNRHNKNKNVKTKKVEEVPQVNAIYS